MKRTALALVALTWSVAFAQTGGSKPVPVTADNFIRAESDGVFTGLVAQGGVGKFFHNRQLTPIDDHVVQRANRETLFNGCVRPRCRAGDDHASGRRQALLDDDCD